MILNILLLVSVMNTACVRNPAEEAFTPSRRVCLRLSGENGLAAGVRSALVEDDCGIKDLNVWLYSSSGKLVESHYFDAGDMADDGSLSFETDAGARSMVVVTANAGRGVDAPGEVSGTCSLSPDCTGGVLMSGAGFLTVGPGGLQCSVMLLRLMARVKLELCLDASLVDAGAVLGSNVRVSSVRLCNSPSELAFSPSDPDAAAFFRAEDVGELSDGDYLTREDIASLYAGRPVFLYCLPNWQEVPYSAAPGAAGGRATYIEMKVDFDAVGACGAGSAYCRFHAGDGVMLGLKGGCNYAVRVILSNDAGTALWRKDDFRLGRVDALVAGTSCRVDLLQEKNSGNYAFSLSPDSLVKETDTFRIRENLEGGVLKGVILTALSEGDGTIYVFGEGPDGASVPLAQLPVSSRWPDLSVMDADVDVTGTPVSLLVPLRPSPLETESEELYRALYSIVSVSPGSSEGTDAGRFLSSDPASESIYVSDLHWEGGDYKDVNGRIFPVTVKYACGLQSSFNVRICNGVIGPLAQEQTLPRVYNISSVQHPNGACLALRSGVEATMNGSMLDEFAGSPDPSLQGYGSWLTGDTLEGEEDMSGYMTEWGLYGARWSIPVEWVESRDEGGNFILHFGKLNPWCGEYVSVPVASFGVTRLIPFGLDIRFVDEGDFIKVQFADHGSGQVDIDWASAYKQTGQAEISDVDKAYGMSGAYYRKSSSNGCFYLETGFKADTVYLGEQTMIRQLLRDSDKAETLNVLSPYTPASGFTVGGTGNIAYVRKEEYSVKAYFDWSRSPSWRP